MRIIESSLVLLLFWNSTSAFGLGKAGKFDYDVVVIGAGASGMFAAGTSSSFGYKTLLVDKHDLDNDADFYIGGDCTNAACVPSKAIRCAAKIASIAKSLPEDVQQSTPNEGAKSVALMAREHSKKVVNTVRSRESPKGIATSTPNLDIIYSPQISFRNEQQLCFRNPFLFNNTYSGFIVNDDGTDSIQISAKKFIICTGADPKVPPMLAKSAKKIGLHLLTYRTLFRPDGEGLDSDFLWDMKRKSPSDKRKRVVIAGGGAAACEIAQSLARLNDEIKITIVAPKILASEDIVARVAARKILQDVGVNIITGKKVLKAARLGQLPILELSDQKQLSVDILICATGREPGGNLGELQLENAGIEWSPEDGVIVDKKLRSISRKNVFAAGDCASAIPKSDRRAAHAGWTGYHAVQSALFPRALLPSDIIHPYVPRVTFLDPEIASIGMTRSECVRKFGVEGFKYLKVDEKDSDRSDIDSIERPAHGFVELRVSLNGSILGATACSPAASEIINGIGVALVNKLTVRDISRSIHAYPSYGYLMHRAALSLAMSDIWGVLDAFGPILKIFGNVGRTVQGKLRRGKKSAELREWQAKGEENELRWEKKVISVSYLEGSKDRGFCEVVRRHTNDDNIDTGEKKMLNEFIKWLDSKP
jgi:pyruvate/2-oxoglutarate dehydrogenase complex dihydrolipoamide dehydrogenase (E3) component